MRATQLANARALLTARFEHMAAAGDSRRYHFLGPVTVADEAAVSASLASIQEALESFATWGQGEQPATTQRYLQHCKDASNQVTRLQDNRRALSECRRLLERHTDASSRPKFLNQLEAVARDAGLSFFSMEDETAGGGADAGAPTHCICGQTFVLDLHLDQMGAVRWAKLQRSLADGTSVPDEESAASDEWVLLNKDIAGLMVSPDMEAALREQFRALEVVEQAHAAHPTLAVYDHFRSMEVPPPATSPLPPKHALDGCADSPPIQRWRWRSYRRGRWRRRCQTQGRFRTAALASGECAERFRACASLTLNR
jgi:hypothetical protein